MRKDYGAVTALRGLDLDARDGEFLVLLGPSGSGKSTALRLAAGLEQTTSGTISIGVRDVTRLPPAKRNVSMVFQSYALFPHLTVEENVGFGLAARRVERAETARRVRAAAELAGCEHILARKPFELSGGERQRVALARAVVREPDVFLLDEPLSNLDAQLRVRTRAELKQLHGRLSTTTVYVTHDQVEALTMGDRVAVLEQGLLQQVGDPSEIYRRPVNRFVATFIGSPAMNVFPATLDGGTLRAGPFAFPDVDGERLDGRPLEVGIRPEHLSPRDPANSGARALVQLVEAAGNETYLHLAADDDRLVARVGEHVRPAVGGRLGLDVARSDVYVFDADSGAALAAGLDG